MDKTASIAGVFRKLPTSVTKAKIALRSRTKFAVNHPEGMREGAKKWDQRDLPRGIGDVKDRSFTKRSEENKYLNKIAGLGAAIAGGVTGSIPPIGMAYGAYLGWNKDKIMKSNDPNDTSKEKNLKLEKKSNIYLDRLDSMIEKAAAVKKGPPSKLNKGPSGSNSSSDAKKNSSELSEKVTNIFTSKELARRNVRWSKSLGRVAPGLAMFKNKTQQPQDKKK